MVQSYGEVNWVGIVVVAAAAAGRMAQEQEIDRVMRLMVVQKRKTEAVLLRAVVVLPWLARVVGTTGGRCGSSDAEAPGDEARRRPANASRRTTGLVRNFGAGCSRGSLGIGLGTAQSASRIACSGAAVEKLHFGDGSLKMTSRDHSLPGAAV